MKFAYIDRPMEPLIGAKEAAEYLGFSSLTVRRMAQRGELPCYSYPFGKGKFLHRFRVSDLQAYLDSIKRVPVQKHSPAREENLVLKAG